LPIQPRFPQALPSDRQGLLFWVDSLAGLALGEKRMRLYGRGSFGYHISAQHAVYFEIIS